jgi:GNAT superfamily N-acetyltransferase
MERAEVVVRPVEPEDREAWAVLFRGYRTFYEIEGSADVVDRVWGWLQDPGHEVDAIVAVLGGQVVGFAHHRSYSRPSEGETGLFLDDLFTAPDVRGRGVARALIERLTEVARERGAAKVRWMTAPDNHTAQRLYDDVAARTDWLTYDLIL